MQRLKLWLGEIVFLSFTLELWVAPRHSNDTIANITWQVHCNDRPRTSQMQTRNRTIIPGRDKMSRITALKPCVADDLNEPSATRTTWSNIKGTWNKKAKTTGSVDSTNNWVNWQYWVQTCYQFHYQLTTCLSVEPKDVDAKPLPPAPPCAVRSSSASNPQALQRTLASQ